MDLILFALKVLALLWSSALDMRFVGVLGRTSSAWLDSGGTS